MKRNKSLFDCLNIIISPSTRFTPFQQSLDHRVVFYVETNDERTLPDVLFELNRLFDLLVEIWCIQSRNIDYDTDLTRISID